MTPAGQRWTRSKPTEPGWYWWRRPLVAPTLALVFGPPQGLLMYLPEDETSDAAISVSATYEDTEWLGPLSPDDRQQGRVAGLRECLDMLEGEIARDRDSGVLESLRQRMEAKLEECK